MSRENMARLHEKILWPRPGYYGTPMTLTVHMGPLVRNECLPITMTEEDGYSELRHFTLCFSIKQPVPPPSAKKVPKFVAYVCETGIQDEEESKMEFSMHIESDEGKVLRPAVTSRCLSPGAGHPPGIYFTPAGNNASKYVKSVVFNVVITKADEDDIDTDIDEEASNTASEEEEEENDETDATMSPLKIGQGIAQARTYNVK